MSCFVCTQIPAEELFGPTEWEANIAETNACFTAGFSANSFNSGGP